MINTISCLRLTCAYLSCLLLMQEDGSSVDVHINLGQVPMQSEAQLRLNQAQTMVQKATRVIAALEVNVSVESVKSYQ